MIVQRKIFYPSDHFRLLIVYGMSLLRHILTAVKNINAKAVRKGFVLVCDKIC